MKRIALVLVLVLCCCTTSTTTPRAVIRGVVQDNQGTPLPGVTVTLQTSAGSVTKITDAQGRYEFAGLVPSRYLLQASVAGLQTVNLNVDTVRNGGREVPIVLRAASVSESITITAHSPAPGVKFTAFQETITVSSKAPPLLSTSAIAANVTGGGDTASYAKIIENGYAMAEKQPVTTFSIDVDGASYANVRRFLKQDLAPPADAVRIEEMVNYFTYHYPQPADGRPLAISSEVAGCPWTPEHRLLRIGLQAKSVDPWKQAPNNLVFLLDVSGSMQPPDRLPLVKRAMGLLLDQLRPYDTVAVVVYAGAAGLVVPPTRAVQKDKILTALAGLQAGGSTAGGEGIELAYKVAAEHFDPRGNNRVILATDGDFNVGVSDNDGLTKLIEEKRKSGIYLTCIGVGDDNLQDSLIETLADKGNGNYYYLDSIEEAKKVFATQLTGTLVSVADDVKVQVEFDPHQVAWYRQIGYENRALANKDFTDDTKDAGELGSGQSVTALYEIVPVAGTLPGPMATIRVRYKEPGAKSSQELVAQAADRGKTAYDATPDTQFAAAVAEFGMLLRDSKNKGRATYGDAAALARAMRGEDMEGFREELIRLVEASRAIMGEQRVASR